MILFFSKMLFWWFKFIFKLGVLIFVWGDEFFFLVKLFVFFGGFRLVIILLVKDMVKIIKKVNIDIKILIIGIKLIFGVFVFLIWFFIGYGLVILVVINKLGIGWWGLY